MSDTATSDVGATNHTDSVVGADGKSGTLAPASEIKPGLHFDLPAKEYHAAHEWLSCSGAKKLVPPSCPAKFKAAQSKADERKRHFDLGKIVHTLTLGEGDEFEIVQALNRQKEPYNATSYDLVSAQNHRDQIYAVGKVPILAHEFEAAEKMAAKVKAHPIAGRLFVDGLPEVSAFWTDPATGVQCRARFDYLPEKVDGRRIIVPDLKTALSAEPGEFARAAGKFQYYLQQEWYRDALIALGIDDDPAFLFAVVEKEDPHVVTVAQFRNTEDIRLARALNDKARRIYRECSEADEWPGYHPGIADLSLPTYIHYAYEEFLA